MYLGIDIGTSGVKAILMDEGGAVVDIASTPLAVSRPHDLWSEQDPEDWWAATNSAVRDLDSQKRHAVKAIGLSGQMHGATLLGADGQALRPAILWNDGRSARQCAALEADIADLGQITGNRAMPGFTAPKLQWVRENEPDIFAEVKTVLLPKDYVRLRLPEATRAKDLVSRMTLEEKAGAMMHGTVAAVDHPLGLSTIGYDLAAMTPEITERHITSMITRLAVSPAKMAEENNKIQEIAARGRLSIPVTISTDPRHHFQIVSGASTSGTGYSQWPESLGFGALSDLKLMKRFGDVARQEYRATGIHQALSPQADLFTEPRWPRGTATFGSNPAKARDLVQAYVEGFQGGSRGLTRDGVLTVVKHWVAYGASPEGWDGHNYYGRFARASNASFAGHVEAFKGAFKVQVAGVMPTYDIVQGVSVNGKPLEPVAAGYNKQLLTDLLRKTPPSLTIAVHHSTAWAPGL